MKHERQRVMKQHAPATDRNREPILAVLKKYLPASGTVLEIASGSGEHAVYFAPHFPQLIWQPTDADDVALASIAAWVQSEAAYAPNIKAPVFLDVQDHPWPIQQADAVVCINMIHIAPWAACLGLLAGAARLLSTGQYLYLYGPYNLNGQFTSDSNATFDASLRARNDAWGIRDVADVQAAAADVGFELADRVQMPANNQSLLFVKT